jgi:hypothetical protein
MQFGEKYVVAEPFPDAVSQLQDVISVTQKRTPTRPLGGLG